MRPRAAVFAAGLMALLLVSLGWFYANQDLFPPNSLPWKPVILDAPPRWLAHWQLNRMQQDREQCRAALGAASRLVVTPLQDRRIAAGNRFAGHEPGFVGHH